jgi:1,4-alpha-glucan branching enzyme
MGAILYDDGITSGTTFRLWAEHATDVWVSGTFNNWSVTDNPLFPEGNGYWSADVPGAAEKHRYRFIINSPFTPPEGHWRTDPYCRDVLDNDNADGVIVADRFDWSGDNFQMPPWNELVIYELHVASFNRSGTAPGDFSSIIAKLDYLRDLGINAIEILPIFGFFGKFSLGYNPAFPFDIESAYGDPNSFKGFIREAHARGIAVLLDVVYNHFGPDELNYSLLRFDGWHQDNGDGIYFYNDWRKESGFGPRPDFGRGEVRQYILDNVMMWLQEYHIDGLRFDSTVNIRNAKGNNNDPGSDLRDGWTLLQWINNEVDRHMPWKITIAEDLQHNEWITRPTAHGGAGFDAQWDSSYFHDIRTALTADRDEDRNLHEVKAILEHGYDGDTGKRLVYINNHDECALINRKHRLPDAIWMGNADSWTVRKRYTLGAAVLFTTPGIPLIFQGDEFLEWGQWSDSGTLDWSKRHRFTGIWDLFQALIRLRRNWYNNTRGLRGKNIRVFHVNHGDKVMAWHRWEWGGKGDDTVVVANFSAQAFDNYLIGFPAGGSWHVRFNSDWNGYSPDFGNHPGYHTTAYQQSKDGLPFAANIGIGPYSVLILSQ